MWFVLLAAKIQQRSVPGGLLLRDRRVKSPGDEETRGSGDRSLIGEKKVD